MSNNLLTTTEAATYISMSKDILEKDRSADARIPIIKMGSRVAHYRKSDPDAYIDNQVRTSTCDNGQLN